MGKMTVALSTLPLLACLSGCASGAKKTIAEQQAQLATLQARANELTVQVHDRDAKVSALESAKTDAEAKAKELSEKLAAAQAQVDSLQGSNKELSKSLEADKGALGAQVKQAVAEKDKLAKQLSDLSKDRARLAARLARLAREEKAAREQAQALQSAADAAKAAEKEKAAAAAQARDARLARVHEEMGGLADAALKQIEAEQAGVEQKGEAIELTLREPLLFEPQQAKLTDAGAALLDRVGAALRALPQRPVRVEGHSDNSRIKWELFGRFTSHWDLSAARATAVARYLHEHAGLDPRLLTPVAYGEWRPVKPNDTQEGRAANSRVVIVVEPPAQPESAAPQEKP